MGGKGESNSREGETDKWEEERKRDRGGYRKEGTGTESRAGRGEKEIR